MSIPKLSLSLPLSSISFFLLVVVFLVAPTNGSESRKLDETGLPGSTDPSIKCGGCSPCGGATCYYSPPPPPPVLPPPPPKKPPSPPKPGCPPPPYSPGFIYVGAPPGDLYPIDQTYAGSTRMFSSGGFLAILGCGLMGFLII